VTAALRAIGCEVREVRHVERIADAARVLRPKLVIIGFVADASIAAMAAIAELQKRDARLPIIVIVSGGSEAVAVAAFRAGVRDYFGDPLDGASLAASARRYLSDTEPHPSPVRASDAPPATIAPLIAPDGSPTI
jgi:DNA-binding NtrC family response regulator